MTEPVFLPDHLRRALVRQKSGEMDFHVTLPDEWDRHVTDEGPWCPCLPERLMFVAADARVGIAWLHPTLDR